MKQLIRVSKVTTSGPATPIYVNVDHIICVERTPGPGAQTTTIWGVSIEQGQSLKVAEPVDQVVAMVQEALK